MGRSKRSNSKKSKHKHTKDRGAMQKVDGQRERVANATWGSGGAAPENNFKMKLAGLLENAHFIILNMKKVSLS